MKALVKRKKEKITERKKKKKKEKERKKNCKRAKLNYDNILLL